MAEIKKPTAANIISSLGVKGAIAGIPAGEDAADYAQFIPVLGKDGKLSADFIPSSAVEKVVRSISNVAVVDPNTEVEEANRSGSPVAPFKSLHEAAQKVTFDSSKRCAVLLMPGKYSGDDNSYMEFDGVDSGTIAIIGIGDVELSASVLNIYGSAVSGGRVYLQNITTNNSIKVLYVGSVVCFGRTYIGKELLIGQVELQLSSEARIASTDTQTIHYLSELSYIGNTSTVPGTTAKDALDRLNARRVRISKVSLVNSRLEIESSSFEDVTAESSSGVDIYDLRQRDRVMIQGINELRDGLRNINAETVKAQRIIAEEIQVGDLKMNALTLGGFKLSVDAFGYLVVLDGDADVTPPKGVILIEDTGSSGGGAVYALSVSNGRLYIGDDIGNSSDSEVLREFSVMDVRTGEEYVVTCVDGRLEIVGVVESGGSAATYAPHLYAINEDTGKYHKVVAVTDGGKTTLKVVQDGISEVQFETMQTT